MSLRLPVISGLELIKLLDKTGLHAVRQSGSHVFLKGFFKNELRMFPVPLHRELAIGTLNEIIKQSGLTKEEFLKLHKKGKL